MRASPLRAWLIYDVGQKTMLSEALIDETCARVQMSRPDLFDAFAREVAEGYAKGKYVWSDCDVAMTTLFAFAYAVSSSSLPDYAFRVYIAFDEGEYRDGGELVTQKLLAEIS